MKNIIIVAGDRSGDIYGGLLSKKLKKIFPNKLKIYSLGGDSLKENSIQIVNLTKYSVSGIFEVLLSLKKILNIFSYALNEIDRIKPDLIILIDFPDFNLRLAEKINKKYPIIYYVSPQVWAWRRSRIEILRRYVDKLVVIFEFEKDFYLKEGIEVLYFGHPLLEIIPEQKIQPQKIITFLPGSRKNEIKRHLPLMVKTKNILKRELPDYNFYILKTTNVEKDFYYRFIDKDLIIKEHSYDSVAESEFVITSSGTSTLEVALLGIPFAIIYKLNFFSWLILKNLISTQNIGLVNIVGKKRIVEEFIQYKATAYSIANYTLKIIKDKHLYCRIQSELIKIRDYLLPKGATESLAKYIGDFLNLNSF
ncbi:MAG: lipid-A-disaccharide synthase [Candidatus Omnitrophica bacterium]|nr:lipid-A-disaccharide synthase [Candidatus Omnitrophota bacterium]MCM8826359.1 lipid-A-disaccharide synthase [Candidatus Omnitrophota bacterium]